MRGECGRAGRAGRRAWWVSREAEVRALSPEPRSRRVGCGWKAREERGGRAGAGEGRSAACTREAEARVDTRTRRLRSRSPPALDPAGGGFGTRRPPAPSAGSPGAWALRCGGLRVRVSSGAGAPR